MASRSFKPASFLARPSFNRTSSGGSTKSEDSFVSTLRSLALEKDPDRVSPGPSHGAERPGRKRSQPIAIEPPKTTKVYTPLTARGDLTGGYFPNHQDLEETPQKYRPHSFSSQHTSDPVSHTHPSQPSPDTPNMSATSSAATSPVLPPMSPKIPTALLIPRGKYHPSNYKSPSLVVGTPSRSSTSATMSHLQPTNLRIPSSKNKRPGHERQSSDVKKKLQEYQRSMITQAKNAAKEMKLKKAGNSEPTRPELKPKKIGSPAPITPLELEGEETAGGYLAEGERRGRKMSSNLSGRDGKENGVLRQLD